MNEAVNFIIVCALSVGGLFFLLLEVLLKDWWGRKARFIRVFCEQPMDLITDRSKQLQVSALLKIHDLAVRVGKLALAQEEAEGKRIPKGVRRELAAQVNKAKSSWAEARNLLLHYLPDAEIPHWSTTEPYRTARLWGESARARR